jgi:cation diffusion facilitator family transporter
MDELTVERVGWYSIGVNVLLALLNMVIAAASGSLAVAAEMVHNLVDLISSIAVLLGLKLSQRKSEAFPYGLYKVENIVTVGIALLIFLTGYEIAKEALFASERQARVSLWMLGGVALSMIIPLAFSLYEMRVGRVANSPSLMADAQEYRVHVFSSGVVFVALVAQLVGWPLDRPAALLVVLLVVRTGWELLVDAMRVLLDASLDAETLAQARAAIEEQPAVVSVRSLTGRNAGRYRFLEAKVDLRVADLGKAYQVSQAIETAIREQVPHVERVLIHTQPMQKEVRRAAVPLADVTGKVSQHFGIAPYFALVDVRVTDGTHLRQDVMVNPHRDEEKQRGLKVARWLLQSDVDVVVSQDDIRGKGPGYVLGDAGVTIIITDAMDRDKALAQWEAKVVE